MPRYVVLHSHVTGAIYYGRLRGANAATIVLADARAYIGVAPADGRFPRDTAFRLANAGPDGAVTAPSQRLTTALVQGDILLEVTPAARAAWEGARLLDVVLTSWGLNKIAVIKAIREMTGLGLKEAKDLAEAVAQRPQAVKRGLAAVAASDAAQRLREAGAAVQLVPSSA